MRKLFFISRDKELAMIQKLAYEIDRTEIHPDHTCLLMVSPDYSAIAAQILAHELTKDRDMLHIEAVHVPFPDEDDRSFLERFRREFSTYGKEFKNFVLVEAGIIRGYNWQMIVDVMRQQGVMPGNITTVAVFENVHSIYKSTYVGEYYDNETHDLTYWWERPNKHWDNY